MALRDRAVFNADGTCQMSMEGFDIDTASLDQMSFDSRFSNIGQAVWGSAKLQNRENIPGKAGPKKTVLFGRAFSAPPMFLFAWQRGTEAFLRPPWISGYNTTDYRLQKQVDAKVGKTSAVFTNWHTGSTGITVYWKALI
jgi:hypothetical protein